MLPGGDRRTRELGVRGRRRGDDDRVYRRIARGRVDIGGDPNGRGNESSTRSSALASMSQAHDEAVLGQLGEHARVVWAPVPEADECEPQHQTRNVATSPASTCSAARGHVRAAATRAAAARCARAQRRVVEQALDRVGERERVERRRARSGRRRRTSRPSPRSPRRRTAGRRRASRSGSARGSSSRARARPSPGA